ncbi:ABC transporter substrate-binding protein [Marinomonas arenicola]|uniref:ABC transporter substrate-binding protein n=1 Tax=Marinomonas arenicola TaxID=569601 RepID=UPI00311F3F76
MFISALHHLKLNHCRFFARAFLLSITTLLTCQAASAVTLKMAFDADPVSLDPHEQLSEGTLQFSHMVFDPLVRWKQNGQIEPRLATHWKQITPTTTRFFLRKNVHFQTGNVFTAEDVAYTIRRLKRSPDFRAMFDAIRSVVVINKYTVDIRSTNTNPLLLNIMTYVFPMDKVFYQGRDEIIKFGNSFASQRVSGTGPFIVQEREPGVRMVLTRNKDYWDTKSKGNVDKIILTPIKTDSTRLAALLSGDVDFIFPVSPIDIERTKNSKGIKIITLPTGRILLLHLNEKRRSEFRDVRVRRAINLAINQQLIVEKILRGYAIPAGQLSASKFLGHVDSIKPEYNLPKALELMKQAGYEKGFRVSMMAPNNRYMNDDKVAQAIAAMLGRIHITVDLKTLPKAQYFQQYDERAADIMMLGWQSDTEDSNNLFEFIIACQDAKSGLGAYNASEYCAPSINEDIKLANREMNPEKRARIMQQVEIKLHNDAAIVPLYWQYNTWAAKNNLHIESIVNDQNYPFLGDLVIDEK